jgi:hypothetical protein
MDNQLITEFNMEDERLKSLIINDTYRHVTVCNPAVCYPDLINKIKKTLIKWREEKTIKEEELKNVGQKEKTKADRKS